MLDKKLLIISVMIFILIITILSTRASTEIHLPNNINRESTSNSINSNHIRAVTYFGKAWALNFWNSDFSNIDLDFSQIKNDGFNTIVLVVPWGEFQPGISPIRYNEESFKRLHFVLDKASSHRLNVVLRLSYPWDYDPDDQLPFMQRFNNLVVNNTVHDAWLDYFRKVHSEVKDNHNVLIGFISWEDLWGPINEVTYAKDISSRIQLAQQIGFTNYMQKRFTLKEVSDVYGYNISDWRDLPTPARNSPSFKLFLKFYDTILMQRLFLPAQANYPNLSMEVRVDKDPIYDEDGKTIIDWFSHSDTYNLPHSQYTVIYYSTSMGSPNKFDQQSASKTLSLFDMILGEVKNSTIGKKIFIDQFVWADDTPGFEENTKIYPNEVSTYLRNACYSIYNYTNGYAVWAYKDYKSNIIFNPSFVIGLKGWNFSGTYRIVNNGIDLDKGASIGQSIPISRFIAFTSRPLDQLSFYASAISANTTIRITVDDNIINQNISKSGATYNFKLSKTFTGNHNVTFNVLNGTIFLSNIDYYNFEQHGNVWSANSLPEIYIESIRQLNKCLTLKDSNSSQLHPGIISYFPLRSNYTGFDYTEDPQNYGRLIKSNTVNIDQTNIFDGEKYIVIQNDSEYDFDRNTPFSISFKVKPTAISGIESIISKRDNLTSPGWAIDLWGVNNKLTFKLVNKDEVNELRVRAELELNDNQEHNILITYDGSSRGVGVKIYDNGRPIRVGIETDSLTGSILNKDNMVIGGYADGTNRYKGVLENIKIYDRVIDPF